MAGIGHVAVGLAAGRLFAGMGGVELRAALDQVGASPSPVTGSRLALWMVLGVGFSMLPDADVIAFSFGIPYHAPWGHRGASHSLFFACALGALLACVAWVCKASRGSVWRVGLFVALVVASHGLLDTLTTGGLGAALLWPLSNERFFAPWRLIPVSPIGFGVLSRYGFYVIRTEALLFLPFFLYAFWPRKRGTAAIGEQHMSPEKADKENARETQ